MARELPHPEDPAEFFKQVIGNLLNKLKENSLNLKQGEIASFVSHFDFSLIEAPEHRHKRHHGKKHRDDESDDDDEKHHCRKHRDDDDDDEKRHGKKHHCRKHRDDDDDDDDEKRHGKKHHCRKHRDDDDDDDDEKRHGRKRHCRKHRDDDDDDDDEKHRDKKRRHKKIDGPYHGQELIYAIRLTEDGKYELTAAENNAIDLSSERYDNSDDEDKSERKDKSDDEESDRKEKSKFRLLSRHLQDTASGVIRLPPVSAADIDSFFEGLVDVTVNAIFKQGQVIFDLLKAKDIVPNTDKKFALLVESEPSLSVSSVNLDYTAAIGKGKVASLLVAIPVS